MTKRSDEFGRRADEELKQSADTMLKKGRILLVEKQCADALTMIESGDIEGGKSKLNTQIRSLGPGGLKS